VILFCEENKFHTDNERIEPIPLLFDNSTANSFESGLIQFKDLYLNSNGRHTEYRHAGFVTIPEYTLPEPSDTVFACRGFGKVGVTGIGAKPKVKYNWDWAGAVGEHIALNECDASNPTAVYCDMTQFNIAHLQRLLKLKAFLEDNYSSLSCPKTTWNYLIAKHTLFEQSLAESVEPDAEGELLTGAVGIEKIEYLFVPPASEGQQNKLTVYVTVANQLNANAGYSTPVPIKAEVKLINPELSSGYYASTTCGAALQSNALSMGHSQVLSCEFDGITENDNYSVSAKVVEPVSEMIHDPYLSEDGTQYLYDELSLQGISKNGVVVENACPTPFNQRTLKQFLVDPMNPITWGGYGFSDITDADKLYSLINYDALLVKDAFTEDFRNDFDQLYRVGGCNALKGVPQEYCAADDGLWKLFTKPDYFKVERIGGTPPVLPAAGKYSVETIINFESRNWYLINPSTKQPTATIKTVFTLKEPEYSNELYYLPFDGEVGLTAENKMDRQGYGMGFASGSEEIRDVIPWTDATGTSPLIKVKGKNVITYGELNSAANKGNLLRISNIDESRLNKDLVLSPSIATPVILKVKANETASPVEVYYSLVEGGASKAVGSNLGLWTGLGSSCYDLQGNYVKNKFREPGLLDSLKQSSENIYGLKWTQSLFQGAEYLNSIMFTPKGSQMALKMETPTNVVEAKLIGPNDWGVKSPENWKDVEADQVNLSGNALDSMKADLSSIKKILNLMDQNFVCLSYGSGGTELWWNPKKILEQEKGAGQSIKAFEDKLNITSPEIIPCIRS
jgi:hypothetical protein